MDFSRARDYALAVYKKSANFRDAHTQVLTHTLPDSAAEQQTRYDEYLKSQGIEA